MVAFLAKYGIELMFGLISAGALAFCKHLWSKNKELENYKKADQNRQYRQMIINEIEPLIDELSKVQSEVNKLDTQTQDTIAKIKAKADKDHANMYQDLNKIQAKNDRNFELILNSYKFRLIQLCKCHLRDDYITEDDFEQISEMYKLYHSLGGNGQAQEYYDKVLKLDTRPNER